MPINSLASFTPPTIPNQDEAEAAAQSANDASASPSSSECSSTAPSGAQAAASGAPIAPVDKASAHSGGQQGGSQEHGGGADGGSSLASLRYRAGIDSTMVSAKLADATQAHAQAQSQAQQTGRDTLSLSRGVAQAPDPHGSHLTSDPETAQAQKRQLADQQRRAAELNKNIKDLQALQKATQPQTPGKPAQPQTPGKTTAQATPQQPDKSNSQPNPPKAEQQQGWWKSWGSTATHSVLGAASFVPGVSVISGAIDSGIYAAEGDYLNAGLSAASMIPGGKEVTTVGKVIAKGVKVAEEAKTLEKTTKLAEEATKLNKTETLVDAGTVAKKEGQEAGKAAGKAEDAAKTAGGTAAKGTGEVATAGAAGTAAKKAVNFSRELTTADLGIKGTVQELHGTFAVKDGIATMRVDMIRGKIQNPLQVMSNMIETAKANGATTLRIEGTIANERLYNILQNRYGLTSSGATDLITIPIR